VSPDQSRSWSAARAGLAKKPTINGPEAIIGQKDGPRKTAPGEIRE